jgi:hypothetical protein
MKLTPLKDGYYRLGPFAEPHEQLEEIPALRAAAGHYVGRIDAIAAACKIVGRPLPVRAAPLQDGHWLPGIDYRQYQQDGVMRILDIAKMAGGGALLADDMGLGKTLQALTAMRAVIDGGGRALVVAPAAALETWRDELTKWGFQSFAVLTASPLKKNKAEWATAPEKRIVVCSADYRMIERSVQAAFPDAYPQAMLFDEMHRFRGRDSLRSQTLSDYAPLAQFRLGMTATPQMARPRDWYSPLRMLFGSRFGAKHDFDRRYCAGQHNGYGWENKGASNLEELKLRLGYYMVRREKHEVAKELPPLSRQVRWVDADPKAVRAYEAYKLGVGRHALQHAMDMTLRAKAIEAMRLAAESRKFFLTTWRVADAQYMHETLDAEYDTPSVLIHGGIDVTKRADLLRYARAKGIGVVATIDSTAEALNLQGIASVGICHAIDYVALKMAQMEARLHRLGTVDPIMWYYLAMRDTIDLDIVRTVVNRMDQWVQVMGKGKRAIMEAFADYIDGAEIEQEEKKLLLSLYGEMSSVRGDEE